MHGVVLQHCLVSESFHWLLYSAVCLVLCLHTHVHVQRSPYLCKKTAEE